MLRISVIIATLDRAESLGRVLRDLLAQTQPPAEVLISSGSSSPAMLELQRAFQSHGFKWLDSPVKSAAIQRNKAAEYATGDLLAFLDDDIEFGPTVFARMAEYFAGSELTPAAVSARMAGEDRKRPGWVTRTYYALQSGARHPDYGGMLFGPGITNYPVFAADSPELVASQWLPATCLFVRASLFGPEKFPSFAGYSYGEDAHLTARLARIAPIYFSSKVEIVHRSGSNEFKQDRRSLTAGKIRNMEVISNEILGLGGRSLRFRMFLHRLFVTISLFSRRPGGWRMELAGLWAGAIRSRNAPSGPSQVI